MSANILHVAYEWMDDSSDGHKIRWMNWNAVPEKGKSSFRFQVLHFNLVNVFIDRRSSRSFINRNSFIRRAYFDLEPTSLLGLRWIHMTLCVVPIPSIYLTKWKYFVVPAFNTDFSSCPFCPNQTSGDQNQNSINNLSEMKNYVPPPLSLMSIRISESDPCTTTLTKLVIFLPGTQTMASCSATARNAFFISSYTI